DERAAAARGADVGEIGREAVGDVDRRGRDAGERTSRLDARHRAKVPLDENLVRTWLGAALVPAAGREPLEPARRVAERSGHVHVVAGAGARAHQRRLAARKVAGDLDGDREWTAGQIAADERHAVA